MKTPKEMPDLESGQPAQYDVLPEPSAVDALRGGIHSSLVQTEEGTFHTPHGAMEGGSTVEFQIPVQE